MKNIWKQDLSNVITDNNSLKKLLGLNPNSKISEPIPIPEVKTNFALKVPVAFAKKIEKGNPNDPLLKQFLPVAVENISTHGFSSDPLAEAEFIKFPGLIHKYKTRILLVITGTCAINCRYCFRREYHYSNNIVNKANLPEIVKYIEDDTNISEVIFSGGDPLIPTDTYLEDIASKLASIKHIKTIRFHTRIPIVMPSRITNDFINVLTKLKTNIVMVVHSNHPNEIDTNVVAACTKLHRAGILLLNQSVLLKGINDCPEILQLLSEKLVTAKIIPYYLHMLDKIKGSSHFEVKIERAKEIYPRNFKMHNLISESYH